MNGIKAKSGEIAKIVNVEIHIRATTTTRVKKITKNLLALVISLVFLLVLNGVSERKRAKEWERLSYDV